MLVVFANDSYLLLRHFFCCSHFNFSTKKISFTILSLVTAASTGIFYSQPLMYILSARLLLSSSFFLSLEQYVYSFLYAYIFPSL